MSGWNGAKVGLRVESGDKELAKQFLKVLGAKTEGGWFDEHIRKLDADFSPEITGIIEKGEDDLLDILNALDDHAGSYIDKLISGDRVRTFNLLDGLYVLLKKIFPGVSLYVAHEEGNSVSDDYYRYEVIYDPSKDKKKEMHCYYSYGNGINVQTNNQIEEGTEKKEKKISDKGLQREDIQWLIDEAQEKGFSELAKRLDACK